MWVWWPSWSRDLETLLTSAEELLSGLCILFCHFGSLEKNHLIRSVSYNDPRGGAIFDPRGKIGRMYVELHMTMLYIKYTSFVSCCCREDFFIYFHYKSMVDNDMPGAWPVWTHRGTVGSIYKGEYYTMVHTTYESSGPYGFEEDFFMFFP